MRFSPVQGLALYTCVLDSVLANFQGDTPSLPNLGRWQTMRDEPSSPWAPGPPHGFRRHGLWRTYSEKAKRRSNPTARWGDRSRQFLPSSLSQKQYTEQDEDEEDEEDIVLNENVLLPTEKKDESKSHRGRIDDPEQRARRHKQHEKGTRHGEKPENDWKHQGTMRLGGQREDSFALQAVHLPREGSGGWAMDSYRRTMAMGKGLERLVNRIKGRLESVLPPEAENAVAHGRRYRHIIANLSSSLQHFATGLKHFRVSAFEHHQATSAAIRKTMAQAFKEKR